MPMPPRLLPLRPLRASRSACWAWRDCRLLGESSRSLRTSEEKERSLPAAAPLGRPAERAPLVENEAERSLGACCVLRAVPASLGACRMLLVDPGPREPRGSMAGTCGRGAGGW